MGLQKDTYRRFELFQYTACRSLALDRCKFASASVMRLRENVARAIIPPLLVQPWFPSFPSASPLLLSQATCSSQHPRGQLYRLFKVPNHLKNRLSQSAFCALTCSSTQTPLRPDPFGHLHFCQIYLDFCVFFSSPQRTFPVTHQRRTAQVLIRQ